MVRAAAPITDEIVKAIVRFDDPGQSCAETARLVAAWAEQHGLARPSYEALRPLIKRYRDVQGRPSALDLFLQASLVGWTRGIGDELLKPREDRRKRS